jgi:GNAT superfamily N-acetyltransferase
MIIRSAKENDVLSLKRLLVQLGYAQRDELEIQQAITQHEQEGYQLLVAEVDQEVVGFISLHWFDLFHRPEKLGRISAFCVDERFRSRGIGKRLLEETENIFRANGCARIEVTSNSRRTQAHQFYLNRGYTEDSKRFVKNIL